MPALRQRLTRLDRICGALNGWLLALAIGLMILDMTVLVAKTFNTARLAIPAETGTATATATSMLR